MVFNTQMYLQAAQQNAASNSDLLNALQGAAQIYQQRQARDAATVEARRQEVIAQQQAAMKPENILARKMQGLQLSPEEESVLAADQALKGQQVGMNFSGETYRKYAPLQFGEQSAPIGVVDALMPPTLEQQELPAVEKPKMPPSPIGKKDERTILDMELPKTSGSSIEKTPLGQKMRFEKELQFAATKAEKAIEQGAELKNKEGTQDLFMRATDRLQELNDELRKAGALVTADSNALQTAQALAGGGTATGEKFVSPKVRALREEYDRMRGLIVPIYVASQGLGAKGMDTPEERRMIMDSFGDPFAGTYEGNKNAVDNVRGLLGGRKKETGMVGASRDTGSTTTVQTPAKNSLEGKTATNPKTGEKMIFRGGKWQKI